MDTLELSGRIDIIAGDAAKGIKAEVTQDEDGATITITDNKGTTTAKVTNGKDGQDGKDGQNGQDGKDGAKGDKGDKGDKGEKGDTGYTPQRGVDYWTEADKSEIVRDVVDTIGSADTTAY